MDYEHDGFSADRLGAVQPVSVRCTLCSFTAERLTVPDAVRTFEGHYLLAHQ